MERLRQTLGRKVGPFTVGAWLLIIVGGVALGLVLRRRFAQQPDTSGLVTSSIEGAPAPIIQPIQPEAGGVNVVREPTTVTVPDFQLETDQRVISVPRFEIERRERVVQLPAPPAANDMGEIVAGGGGQPAQRVRRSGGGTVVTTPKPVAAPAPKVVAPKPTPVAPAQATVRYTVKPGDTLSAIGRRFGVPWQTIYNANRAVVGSNPNLIKPGQVFVIPSN